MTYKLFLYIQSIINFFGVKSKLFSKIVCVHILITIYVNLFFVTFNKYVGKSDKNQAFTPDHITDFMSKITGVNKHSVVLDPCCGSGSTLRAAYELGRSAYGFEIDRNFYTRAKEEMLVWEEDNQMNLSQFLN